MAETGAKMQPFLRFPVTSVGNQEYSVLLSYTEKKLRAKATIMASH